MGNQAAVMAVLVIALMIAAQSEGSLTQFNWWSSDDCPADDDYETIPDGLCKCNKFDGDVHGYSVLYDGRNPVVLYNDDDCGTINRIFGTTIENACDDFGWKSVKIGRCGLE